MNTETLTPWFPGDMKPARDGVYLRNLFGLYFHSRFVDGQWRRGRLARATWKPERGVEKEILPSRHQFQDWCGVTRKPSSR